MTELWFGPNVASDVLELATQPEFWPLAKSRCSAVQLFIQQILTDTDEEAIINRVGPNRWPAFIANDWFGRIGLPVTLEAGGPKPWSCDGVAAAEGIAHAIERVRAIGHTLAAVTLDEPLMTIASYMPGRCTQTAEQLTEPIGRCIRACRDRGVDQVNIVEAYTGEPGHDAPAIISMFERLQQAGDSPSGLHLDLSDGALYRNSASGLRALRDACGRWGIPCGVVIIAHHQPVTDVEYVSSALAGAMQIHGLLGGWPERLIVESWCERPGTKALDFPHNLPEVQAETHCALLNAIGALS